MPCLMRVTTQCKLTCVLVLVVALVLFLGGGAAWAGFPDVPDSHWAAKDINALDQLGIVGGYPDGTFKPNQTVEQTEAICLVVRAAGLRSESGSQLPQVPFSVPKWAETDMQLATQKGVLQSTDQYQAGSGASRAFVARLLVRMIGQESEAQEGLQLPNFSDADTIPDWAKHYVGVAQKHNLIAGYVDKTFKPNREVSRAELVAFLYRAMQQLPGGSQIPGVNGGAAGTVTPSPSGETVEGTVIRVYPESNAVVVENSAGVLRTLYLPGGADVSVIGSSQSGLNALQVGDKVIVELSSTGYISKISVTARGEAADQGVVYELDEQAGILTLQLDSAGLATFYLSPQVLVQAEGVRFPGLSDIKKGDKVKVTVQNNLVTAIEMLEMASDARGKVVLVDQANRIINLEVEGRLQAYKLPSNVKVVVKGLTNAYLSDIVPGDTVMLYVQNGEVTSVEVMDRSVEEYGYSNGTVVAVDEDNRIVTIKGRDNRLIAFEVRESARIVVDGSERRGLDDLKKDMEVKFRLFDDEIIYIATDNSIGGTVISIDTSGMIMVFQRDNGERKTYIIDKHVDVTGKDQRTRLGDVQRGDYAHILLSQDKVIEIELRTVYTYRVEDVRTTYDRIEVLDAAGKSSRLYIEDGVDVLVPGNKYASINSINVGDTIFAVYVGKDLDRVEVATPRRGEVAHIDSAKGSVQLRLTTGGSATVYFKGDSQVEYGSRVYDSLQSIAVGDRVEVVESQDGPTVFRVMETVTGQLAADGYGYSDGIYLTANSSSGYKHYKVLKDVTVRDENGFAINFNNLKKNQQVRMYLLWDQVCEITVVR